MDITTMLYRIDSLVKAKGWTKEEFYAMVPISSSAVAQWKSKGRVPKDANILRMAEILEVNPDYLRCKDLKESKKPADLSTNELHAALMNVLIGLSPSEVADVISYAAKLRASHKD